MKKNRRSRATGLPSLECKYLEEPLLVFADGYTDIDPKNGILSSAPKSFSPSYKHPKFIRIGFVGSGETVDKAKAWIERGTHGYSGEQGHLRFPGFAEDRGFMSHVEFNNRWVKEITQIEIENLLAIKYQRSRFESLLELLEEKLKLLTNEDLPPQYVVIALPSEVYYKCRVCEYKDKEVGTVHRDLRRAIKALAMKFRIPTQILNHDTFEDNTGDIISKIYWNFFTGLYFKAGGFPWGPVGLSPATCYIGISFFRPLGSTSTMQTSLVQAFDEHGDGLVLRGYEFDWDSDKTGTKSPHLTEQQAHDLVVMVLSRYKAEMGQTPKRVVIHKSSRFWLQEHSGFVAGIREHAPKFDLMALQPQSTVRLITVNKYPPMRGTYFSVGNIDYLYTTGFIHELGEFHGLHVPSPILIADHIGQDTPRETLLNEILTLTKMNWNSSRLGGRLPITLKFSRLVGEILREIPPELEPLPNYKYYM